MSRQQLGERLSQRLGVVTLNIIEQARIGGLFLTGGDIATAVAGALGAEALSHSERGGALYSCGTFVNSLYLGRSAGHYQSGRGFGSDSTLCDALIILRRCIVEIQNRCHYHGRRSSGIGPEIAAAAKRRRSQTARRWCIIGCLRNVERVYRRRAITPNVELRAIERVAEARFAPGIIRVIDEPLQPEALEAGKVCSAGGGFAGRCVKRANRVSVTWATHAYRYRAAE